MITESKIDMEQELARFEAESVASIEYARSLGLKLPDVVLDMAEWLTIKRYAEKHSVSTQVVSNWIARGIIPADCMMELPELNDIRLVKDREYK
jgi:hypothetical protein